MPRPARGGRLQIETNQEFDQFRVKRTQGIFLLIEQPSNRVKVRLVNGLLPAAKYFSLYIHTKIYGL